jgi:hypothetical protein
VRAVLIQVRTRGRPRAQDYDFLGVAPEDFWWRAYRPVTDVERPTILVRSDGRAWQAYVSGIASGRLDSVNTPIQINLALAGDCGTGDDNALALRVITRSATSLARTEGQSISGDRLDQELPADEVDRMLATSGTDAEARAADGARAADAVRAAYAPLAGDVTPAPPEDPVPAGTPPGSDWIGGVTDDAALDAFVVLATGLLAGRAGSALVLNLVEEARDLAGLPDWDGALGVLSARLGSQLGMEVRSLGKDGPPPAAHQARQPMPSRKKALIAAGAVAAIVLIVVIGWLTIPG